MDEWFESPANQLPLRYGLNHTSTNKTYEYVGMQVIRRVSERRLAQVAKTPGVSSVYTSSRRLSRYFKTSSSGTRNLHLTLFPVLHNRTRQIPADVRRNGHKLERVLPIPWYSLPSCSHRIWGHESRRVYQVRFRGVVPFPGGVQRAGLDHQLHGLS